MQDFPGAAFDVWLTTEPEYEYTPRCNCPWESGCSACWPEEVVVPMPTPGDA